MRHPYVDSATVRTLEAGVVPRQSLPEKRSTQPRHPSNSILWCMLGSLLLLASPLTALGRTSYVTLAWDPPAINAEYVTKYRVYYYVPGLADSTNWVETSETYCMVTIPDATHPTVYRFNVTALNAAGLESEPSTEKIEFEIPDDTNEPPKAYSGDVSAPVEQEVPENPLDPPVPQPYPITLQGADPESQPLRYALVSGPKYGTLQTSSTNAVWQYTPANGFNGVDTFIYLVWDYSTESNAVVQQSQTNSVRITVTGTDDPPQILTSQTGFWLYQGGTREISAVGWSAEDHSLGFIYSFQTSAPGQITSLATNDQASYFVTNTFVYTPPNIDFVGPVAVDITAVDLTTGMTSAVQTITIQVVDPTDPPAELPEAAPRVQASLLGSGAGTNSWIYFSMESIPLCRLTLQQGTLAEAANNVWTYDWAPIVVAEEPQKLEYFTRATNSNLRYRVDITRTRF